MAWETRKGYDYYYRAFRKDGHVYRDYIGPGIVGGVAAQYDAEIREIRLELAERQRKVRARLNAITASLRADCMEIELIKRASLLGDGFHRQDRGPWRRPRDD
jgi:hypothetical protein